MCRKLFGSPVGLDLTVMSVGWQGACGVIDFKGVHYPKSVILHAVLFYLRYAVSYRDLEEILADRGVTVDHATLNRWVVKFAPLIAARAQSKKRPGATSWRMDETHIKVKGGWTTCTAQWIGMGKRLISCSLSAATWPPQGGFSSERSARTVCWIGLSSTRAVPTSQGFRR